MYISSKKHQCQTVFYLILIYMSNKNLKAHKKEDNYYIIINK